MKQVFFNEDGTLNVSQSAKLHPSYKRIMDDQYVSLDELGQQYQSIKSIFRKMEETFTDEQKQLVHDLIVESEVYQAVRQHFNEQIEFDGDLII
jgi:phosphoglycolate phosphatase-like HAD superfamily hydrolase